MPKFALSTESPSSPSTSKSKKIRLSLDISAELNERLERLASESDCSKSDVLRKAIALAELMVEAKKQGRKFGIADPHQSLATEIIGL